MVFVAGVGGEGNITCMLFKTVKINDVLKRLFLGFNFLIPVLLRPNLKKIIKTSEAPPRCDESATGALDVTQNKNSRKTPALG